MTHTTKFEQSVVSNLLSVSRRKLLIGGAGAAAGAALGAWSKTADVVR